MAPNVCFKSISCELLGVGSQLFYLGRVHFLKQAKYLLCPFSTKWDANWSRVNGWWCCRDEEEHEGQCISELGHWATLVNAAIVAAPHCFKMLITVETSTISGVVKMF